MVVFSDSALSLLSIMREVTKTRVKGVEAYARVLLDRYTHEKYWLSIEDNEISVESLLLDPLKMVADLNLRRSY